MSGTWIRIESGATRKASRATVTLNITKTGKGRIFVSIPNVAASQCGLENANAAEIYFGDGENAGKLWVKPTIDGEHKVRKLVHAIAVVFDCPAGITLKANSEQISFEKQGTEAGFVVALPAWALPGSSPHAKDAEPGKSAPKPGSLELNGNILSLGNKTLPLTKSEAIVIDELLKGFGKCVRKSQILDALYALDPNGGADDKVVDVWISKLRGKLEERGFDLSIFTHRGQGWELRRPVS